MKRLILLVALTIILLDPLQALPRFAARTGAKCQSCHVNPTGGGMRNFYGSTTYGRDALPIKSWQEEYGLDDFSTQLSDFFSYGIDFRFLYFYQNQSGATRSSFFPMQADVYSNLKLSKKINIYANPAFGLFQRYEIFAMANVLPLNGYVKLGRMTPSYGLRLDDHTAYVREATPFRNNGGQDVGAEIAVAPGPLMLVGAVLNGSTGDRAGDKPRAILSRVSAQFSAGLLNVLIGGSTYNVSNLYSANDRINLLGGFAVLSLEGNFTVLADVERIKGNSTQMKVNSQRTGSATSGFNGAGKDLEQLATYVEGNYVLIQGVDVKAAYDFFDPDTKLATGAVSRITFGFELFPVGGVEVRPLYRYTKDTVLNLTANEIHVLFHFYL